MDEQAVERFWEAHPCGDSQVGGLGEDYGEFFQKYDKFRYADERHILACLDRIDFQDKQVLEIGLGQGAESQQIIQRGARWSGLELTQESVNRVRARLQLYQLPYERLELGSVLRMPFEDDTFDIVFSHGVLHHVPDVGKAQEEIARILRPGGRLIVMVYARISLNYLLSICILRRLGLIFVYFTGVKLGAKYGAHVANARRVGLWQYLRMSNFIHRNTDGPDNPYSKVYTVAAVAKDFPCFQIVESHKEHMHAPPLPVSWLPGPGVLGWHLWVHMTPRGP